MGGKTQQRVAGNVKPSSSGRIRELLINKHGVGNIITFSTLSDDVNQQATSDQVHSAPAKGSTLTESPEKRAADRKPQIPPNDRHTLIVKRVGNRDCFVRVRVPNSSTTDQNKVEATKQPADQMKSAIDKIPSDSNSLPVSSDVVTKKEIATLDEEVSSPKDESVYDPEEQKSQDEAKEEIYNFDTVLEQLERIQDSVANDSKVNSLLDMSDDKINQECELIKILKISVKNFLDELSIEEWDLISRSIDKWINLISRADLLTIDDKKKDFCATAFGFIHQLIQSAKVWKESDTSRERSPMMQSLIDDLDNFHSSHIYQDLIAMFLQGLSKHTQSVPKAEDLSILEALADIVNEVDPKLVVLNTCVPDYLDTAVTYDREFELPGNFKYCHIEVDKIKFKGFYAISGLLRSNHRVVLVSSHTMLSKVMDTICRRIETSQFITEQDDIDDQLFVPSIALMSILTMRDSMMSALLSDYQVGDISVTMEPYSDSYNCTLSYLLVWDLIIQFIVGLDKQIGHRIIHSLKKLGFIPRLLDNIFILLPPLGERDSLNFRVEADRNDAGIPNQTQDLSNYLKSPLKTSMRRPINEIELCALHVYFSIACHMPVSVRKWYNNNSNKRLCYLVNEYTVKHISKVICSLEMENVQEKCQVRADEYKTNNLVIKARPTAREVFAVYTRDEFRMELTIKLPLNYPLGSVQIDGGKRVGVTDVKWRSWLLQLTTFLAHQNGPLLDGIDLWRKNIDKRFEGIEKCTICYSILHSNYQLPKKKCQTCSHMFHSLCLYKWFETSLNTTCPLCRNIW